CRSLQRTCQFSSRPGWRAVQVMPRSFKMPRSGSPMSTRSCAATSSPPARRGWVQAARSRRLRMLPERLVEQIHEDLAPPSAERRLVHADLHGDHVFVRGGHLAGIIDWGDALCGDPYYDLPSLFFGTFGGSKPLLRTFLDAYRWPVGADFACRAMTMTLVHE